MTCTVWVSSFSRRPVMTRPSRVTARTVRFIGIVAAAGSTSARSRAAAVRVAPMSLRSGALWEPVR